jgi:type IV fimbrial biogenesis protein FimT
MSSRSAIKLGFARSSGFTLVELIVVVVVSGIALAIALPSFTSLVERQRVQSASSDFVFSILRARSEAMKRNANVTIQASDSDWAKGWEIVDGAGQVIQVQGKLSNIQIKSEALAVNYNRSGRLAIGATPTFQISGSKEEATRCVSIDVSGRPYVKESEC